MPCTSFRSVLLSLAAALLPLQPALAAANPPSQIRMTCSGTRWELGIGDEALNPGKAKVFDREPAYDDRHNPTPSRTSRWSS